MKALITFFLGTWMLALSGGLQAQTRVVTTSDPIFTRAELDQMLAPIALYPDTVLSHILIAATYPLEVIQAERWARRNSHLDAEAAVNAAALEGWDPSVAALVAFPDILGRMSDDLAWTQNLGDAFLADEGRVMDAIQNLRAKAYASGSLKKMKHVKVQREKQIIIIEPAVERVVYVPYYDTRVVYGPWWWDTYPPVYWRAPASYVHVSGFYWGSSITLGHTFFFSSVHWPHRRIVVIDYHHHHHHPRFYSGRKIAYYEGARRWEHNPVHRRNIVYRSEPVRQRYANYDGGRRFSNDWRYERQRNDGRDAGPRADGRRGDNYGDANLRDGGHRAGLRDENRRDATPNRNEPSREFRRDVREQHAAQRERTGERVNQPQERNPGLPRQVNREGDGKAEQIRERLAANRPTDVARPAANLRQGESQRQPAAEERREQWRERQSDRGIGANIRQEEQQRPRHTGDLEARREQLQRSQPQNTDQGWRGQRREQPQAQQDAREWQNRRAVAPEPQRQERPVPQRSQQQEQRRFEQARPAPQRDHQTAPRPAEREQRRFER